jgi:hypothetical protein
MLPKLFDMERLCEENSIPTAPVGNKHARQGWVNVHCPFCAGCEDYHLGYNKNKGYFYCWRCGWKPVRAALAAVLEVDGRKVEKIAEEYKLRAPLWHDKTEQVYTKTLHLPKGTGPLQKAHARYLEQRGYDPAEIERVWGIYGIGAMAVPAALRWRILIPIYLEKRLVSYTCRALAETRKDKYRACPQELEVFHHKDTLYGLDLVNSKNLVVVEGPTDVWRIGPGAVATFGTQVSYMQRLLMSRFKRVYVLYDADECMAGQIAGGRLGWEMSGYGVEVVQIILPTGVDPSGMSSGDVKHLRKQLGI